VIRELQERTAHIGGSVKHLAALPAATVQSEGVSLPLPALVYTREYGEGRFYMPFEAPTFPILLVVCGLIVLGWEVGRRSTSHEKDS